MSAVADRVLILGGTGMLGHEVVRACAGTFDLQVGLRDPAKAKRAGIGGVHHAFDVWRTPVNDLVARLRPAAVINCIGLVKQLPEAERAVPAIRVNSLFPHELCEACAEFGSRLIHISTDCVFSGQLSPPKAYTEDDVPDARDIYGRTKLLGEVVHGPAVTLRTSIIGWELGRATGLLEWFAAQPKGTVRGFSNAIFSGFTTRAFADILRLVVEDHAQMTGLYHVSTDPIDKYSLLLMLKDALGAASEISSDPRVRINRALDSRRFRSETSIRIPQWDVMIDEYIRDRPHGAYA